MKGPKKILILGGGLAGMSFAVALANNTSNIHIKLIEKKAYRYGAPEPLDTRATALNLYSIKLLKEWGAWSKLANVVAPIKDIHVSHQANFGSSVITAQDVDEPALGYVVENHLLGEALHERANQMGVEIQAPCLCESLVTQTYHPAVRDSAGEIIEADLVLLAGGIDRKWFDFLGIGINTRPTDTTAFAFNALFRGRQRQRAFERFTDHGPLAVLPLPSTSSTDQRFNVIWSVSDVYRDDLAGVSDSVFLERFQKAFGWRLGRVLAIGKRSNWSLARHRALEQFRRGFLLVGNAAHTLHPVAGQGLNLSFREAALLAKQTKNNCLNSVPLGSLKAVSGYVQSIENEQELVITSTDILSTMFDRRGALLDVPRDLSLALLDLIPPFRRRIAAVGVGRRNV